MRLRQCLKDWIVGYVVVGVETIAKGDEPPGSTNQRKGLRVALTDEGLFETFGLIRNRSDHSFFDTHVSRGRHHSTISWKAMGNRIGVESIKRFCTMDESSYSTDRIAYNLGFDCVDTCTPMEVNHKGSRLRVWGQLHSEGEFCLNKYTVAIFWIPPTILCEENFRQEVIVDREKLCIAELLKKSLI